MRHGILTPDTSGGLRIYRAPVAGASYSIGVDTSQGIRGGDPSCAQVIDNLTCEQVAEWHGYYEPTRWGYACARLGAYYNQAWVAIETHPSPHGLVAFNAAQEYGYPCLWQQQRWDSIEGKMVTTKGWHRGKGHETAVVLDRIRVALGERNQIHSVELLDELASFYLDGSEVVARKHDDRVIAYGIALIVRDEAFSMPAKRPESRSSGDLADWYWTSRRSEDTDGSGDGSAGHSRSYPQEQLYNGV